MQTFLFFSEAFSMWNQITKQNKKNDQAKVVAGAYLSPLKKKNKKTGYIMPTWTAFREMDS